MATYPPQGIQSRTGFNTLSNAGKALVQGSNVVLNTANGLQLTSGSLYFGVPQVTLAPADFVTTFTGSNSTAYNASARFLTYTYTPTSGLLTQSLYIDLVYYLSYQTTLVNTQQETYVNIYTTASNSPIASMFNLNTASAPLNFIRQSSVSVIYSPSSGFISAPVTINVCSFVSNASNNANAIVTYNTTRQSSTIVGLCPTALTVTPLYK